MMSCSRRSLLKQSGGSLVKLTAAAWITGAGITTALGRSKTDKRSYTKDQWMSKWMKSDAARASDSPLHLGRFREPIYFLLDPISWTPNENQASRFQAVQVPKGFVSDLASIPRAFYSLLRPDGTYAYAAIIHDYLYWTQSVNRKTADEILKNSMEDFEVGPATIRTIFTAIRAAGEFAWNQNADLKRRGEHRVLTQFPPNARTEWLAWKKNKDVFATE